MEEIIEDGPNGMAPRFVVVLVEPRIEGNVGAVARCMANFGLKDLVLVNPCKLADEAEKRSMHALETLHSARIVETFEEATDGLDYIIGTSAIKTENDKKFTRIPVTPMEAGEAVSTIDGRVGLLFGREDFGLLVSELERCDMMVTIPTDPGYPVMNLSHSVAVVLYEMLARSRRHKETKKASSREKELLYGQYSDLLERIDYPEFKRYKANVMFRRLMGRAAPSSWEYHTMMGVFSRALKRVKKDQEGGE